MLVPDSHWKVGMLRWRNREIRRTVSQNLVPIWRKKTETSFGKMQKPLNHVY